MKQKIFINIASTLLATAFLASCSNDDIVQSGQDNNNTGEIAGVVFEGATQTPTSRTAGAAASVASAATRTTATHTIGGAAKVLWEASDKIWVEDDSHQFRQSSSIAFPAPANQSYAKFGVTTGSFTGTTHKVVYTGKNSTSATEVEIKAAQTQTVTNSFAHLGESGDCGIATATKVGAGNHYGFGAIQHKAAYLAIYPRIEHNALHKNVKIEKIVLTSTSGSIAGKYSFSATNGLGTNPTPTSNASSTITLNTTSGEISSATRVDTCYYVVIVPGTHALKADYYIKDPTTNISGVISKDLGNIPCTEGKITDVSSWIDKDMQEWGNSYYMWDAQEQYWAGHEWYSSSHDQLNGVNYPQSKAADPTRWYNETNNSPFGSTPPYLETHGSQNPLFTPTSASHVPNVNEMYWYALKGDPHWDANKLWALFGHLQKGGMWLKKMSQIKIDAAADIAAAGGDVTAKAIETHGGTTSYPDYRIEDASMGTYPISTASIAAANQNNYFFLPAAGYYSSYSPTVQDVGDKGYYRTSNRVPSYNNNVYSLQFDAYGIGIHNYTRDFQGIISIPFK